MKLSQPIHILDPLVAERIAAGEVIERPGSVVKELVENALDAGATEIQVVLQEGGKQSIEVTDNGSGIAPRDLAICRLRHATSKIRKLEDLESVTTCGFRGEGLAAIAAASNLTLTSKVSTERDAWSINSTSSEPLPVTVGPFLGFPHGTRVRAESLFSTIPARLKFLKSSRSELLFVKDWIERLALTAPQTRFRLVHDDRTVLDIKSKELDRIREILSGESSDKLQTFELISAHLEFGSTKFQAHWLKGSSQPNSRKVFQVVRGRSLKDRLLGQAVSHAFKQALLPGQYPALALMIDLPGEELDVNIHPSKTEVRFRDSSMIFKNVAAVIGELFSKSHPAPRTPAQAIFTQNALDLKWTLNSPEDYSESGELSLPHPGTESFNLSETSSELFSNSSRDSSIQSTSQTPSNLPAVFSRGRYIGSLFATYLVWEWENELGVMDQHAAHERIRYEELKRQLLSSTNEQPASSQRLLIPISVLAEEGSRTFLESLVADLKHLGFELEPFGPKEWIFRTIPSAWGDNDLSARLSNLIQRLTSLEMTEDFKSVSTAVYNDHRLFERIASEACHSSVRAGQSLDAAQALGLLQSLAKMEHPWNCPHGRPTLFTVNRSRFEEWFLRKAPKSSLDLN